jgi:hypothetical protein
MPTNQGLALLLGLVDLGKEGGGLAAEALVEHAAGAATNKLGELQRVITMKRLPYTDIHTHPYLYEALHHHAEKS